VAAASYNVNKHAPAKASAAKKAASASKN